MKKTALIVFLSFFLFFQDASFAARNISITSATNSLNPDTELTITASASGFTTGEKIYIKGAFYKEGSSNYFGYTQFNNDWIKNSSPTTSQKEVVIGDWDNLLNIKVDYSDTGFVGIGEYNFKLGFYYINNRGNLSSVNWSSNSIPVTIESLPTPTPEPQNTAQTTSNLTKSNDGSGVTPSPTKTKSITTAPTSKISPKSAKITLSSKTASEYAKIEATEEESENEEDDSVQVLGESDSRFPQIYLASGMIFLIFAGYMIVKQEFKNRKL